MPHTKTISSTVFRTLAAAVSGIALMTTPLVMQGQLAVAAEQAAAPAPAPTLVKPVPIMQEGLFMAGPPMGNEGIITARYTVKADGTTDDVEIVGGFTNPFYEKAIQDNVAKWTFTPGTVNGAAQDFFNQTNTFMVRISSELGVSAELQKELDPIQALVTAKDFQKAIDEIDRVMKRNVHSVLDYAVMNRFMASAQMGLEDPFSSLESIRNATMTGTGQDGTQQYILTPEMLQAALHQRVIIAASIRAQRDVLDTWAALQAIAPSAADDPAREWVTTAEQAIASPDPLLALGEITDKVWVHKPTHRIFTVADVREGELDKIVARCERRTLELEYQEGVDWNLPLSFGNCELSFEGKDGTLFSIYEFAQ